MYLGDIEMGDKGASCANSHRLLVEYNRVHVDKVDDSMADEGSGDLQTVQIAQRVGEWPRVVE